MRRVIDLAFSDTTRHLAVSPTMKVGTWAMDSQLDDGNGKALDVSHGVCRLPVHTKTQLLVQDNDHSAISLGHESAHFLIRDISQGALLLPVGWNAKDVRETRGPAFL